MLLLVIAAAVQSVAPPPSAPPPAPATAAPSPVAVAAAEKKVCRTEEDVSSRIRLKKVCLPQSEWDAIAKATQADLEGSRNDRTIVPN